MNTILSNESAHGKDGVGISQGVHLQDSARGLIRKWKIAKAEFAESVRAEAEAFLRAGGEMAEALKRFGGKDLGIQNFEGNLLLNEGINELWTLVCGGGGSAFSNANAYIGVGDSSTAEAASQTDLQAATNKLYKAMDASYPTYGTSQKATWRATFGSSEANYAWNEFTVSNTSSGTGKNLNRKVSAQGTKTAGQTWQVSLEITLS